MWHYGQVHHSKLHFPEKMYPLYQNGVLVGYVKNRMVGEFITAHCNVSDDD